MPPHGAAPDTSIERYRGLIHVSARVSRSTQPHLLCPLFKQAYHRSISTHALVFVLRKGISTLFDHKAP